MKEAMATVRIGDASISAPLVPKTFSTGSAGFHSSGKLVVAQNEKYQYIINVVRIGSKPKSQPA